MKFPPLDINANRSKTPKKADEIKGKTFKSPACLETQKCIVKANDNGNASDNTSASGNASAIDNVNAASPCGNVNASGSANASTSNNDNASDTVKSSVAWLEQESLPFVTKLKMML